jgi:hypothetical protein
VAVVRAAAQATAHNWGLGVLAAAAIAHEIDGGACETAVWARLHFRWVSADSGPEPI